MNINQSLQKLGLSPNEITVYTYLQRKGVSSGRAIYKDNELDKSSAYEALSNLSNKGLIYSIGQKRNQKFGAIPTDKLYEIIQEKSNELEEVKKNINDFVQNMDELVKQRYKDNNIIILEGEKGFDDWAEAKLKYTKKGDTIREFISYQTHAKFIGSPHYDTYSKNAPLERVANGVYMKSLTTSEDLKSRRKVMNSIYQTDPKLLKEIRVLPDEPKITMGSSSFATFGNYTALLRKKDGAFFGLMIEDKLITQLLNNMFDIIWHYSKEV